MSSKWSSQDLGKNNKSSNGVAFDELLKDEYAVLLLRGKNTFGDLIYSYVKVALPDITRLQAALRSNDNFTASDFGTVIAAGKGEPTEEVKAEVSLAYPSFKHPDSTPRSHPVAANQPAIPEEKKAWDEY